MSSSITLFVFSSYISVDNSIIQTNHISVRDINMIFKSNVFSLNRLALSMIKIISVYINQAIMHVH